MCNRRLDDALFDSRSSLFPTPGHTAFFLAKQWFGQTWYTANFFFGGGIAFDSVPGSQWASPFHENFFLLYNILCTMYGSYRNLQAFVCIRGEEKKMLFLLYVVQQWRLQFFSSLNHINLYQSSCNEFFAPWLWEWTGPRHSQWKSYLPYILLHSCI